MRAPPCFVAVLVLVSGAMAGCLGTTTDAEGMGLVVTYNSTNATIVEYWEDGELVDTQYPVLAFDFSQSTAPAPFTTHAVKGVYVSGTVDADEHSVVEVEFQHHGFHVLELSTAFGASASEQADDEAYRNEVVVRIEKRIEWLESSTNEPLPMTLDTRNEVGEEPAAVIVIDSTVFNPELINNFGGGQEVEVSWALIDETQEACQSQPGTVDEGESANWKTVHFNTYEVHELRVNYEEGQDTIDVEQTISIQYESLETPPNA